MALSSASVIAVKHHFKRAANISIPRGCPSYLLSLWEALQDQQVGLTQTPFKLLPLPWDSECVRF